MPIIRALLSAFTLFGGHFLNRRFDRVRLVALLLTLVLIPVIGLVVWLGSQPYEPIERFAIVCTSFVVPVLLLIALIALSTTLTFRDARSSPVGTLSIPQRTLGVTLSVFAALLSTTILIYSGSFFSNGLRLLETKPWQPHELLWLSVHFGGGIQYPDEMNAPVSTEESPTPPTGKDKLRGRITLDGIGVRDLDLDVVLSNKYEVRHVETDSEGIFEIPLPAGKWFINSVRVDHWNEKPRDRDVLLFSGHEPRREDHWYVNIGDYLGTGLEVNLPLAPDALAVQLELRDTIAVTWPPHTKPTGASSAPDIPKATSMEASIAWQPVKRASEYEVQLTHVVRAGYSTSSNGILRRRMTGTSLPLSALPTRQKAADAPPDEYEVEIYAFDAAGTLLTQSEAGYSRAFQLAGTRRLGKETWESTGGPNPVVISEAYEANEKLISAIDDLLNEKRLDEAARLLEQVTNDAPPGRASAMRGKLAALKGDCAAAIRLFDQAEREGHCPCGEDRQLCPASHP